jgi:hypothetical protein
MQPPLTCQSCLRPAASGSLDYTRGASHIRNEGFLQCDICERFACPDCLRVYDIFSGYDFLCHTCARELDSASFKSNLGH